MTGWQTAWALLVFNTGVFVFAALLTVVRHWWRERRRTAQVWDEEWAKTLAVAAEYGWAPYVEVAGLPRRAELVRREAYLGAKEVHRG